jgi:nitrogen fixation protein FixH
MIVTTGRPFTGLHMLIIMLSFFAVVLTANLTMVYFARHSWTGLVVKNSYIASQEFNAKTAEMERAAEISVQIEIDKAHLKLTLKDNSGRAVVAQSVALKLGRPSHAGEDQAIPLIAQGAGLFAAEHALAHGQWSGTVSADIAGQNDWSRPVYLFLKD